MPRPGFYNDNEYRAYPFIFKIAQTNFMPNSAIVDCGIIMGLDSEFDPDLHMVWLDEVRRTGSVFQFKLKTDAPGALNLPLIFTRNASDNEWLTEFVESEPYVKDDNSCAIEPAWSGFLVTGPLNDLKTALPANIIKVDQNRSFVLEPARIQSLVKSYLRSITVGNMARPIAKSACDPDTTTPRPVIINKRCITGPIRFKEGYNTTVYQLDFKNELGVGGSVGEGMQPDSALCATGSELPFYEGEEPPTLGAPVPTTFKGQISASSAEQARGLLPRNPNPGYVYGYREGPFQLSNNYFVVYFIWNNAEWETIVLTYGADDDWPTGMPATVQLKSKFFGGGPACSELISSINGVQGPNVIIAAGTGIVITSDDETPNTIKIKLSDNALTGNC
jgi:hypothetical protein